jgi:hypothetical protein
MALPSEAEWIATVGVWKKLLGTKGGASWVSWTQLVFEGEIWKNIQMNLNMPSTLAAQLLSLRGSTCPDTFEPNSRHIPDMLRCWTSAL